MPGLSPPGATCIKRWRAATVVSSGAIARLAVKSHLTLCRRRTDDRARHGLDHDQPVWAAGDYSDGYHVTAVGKWCTVGKHAGLVAIYDARDQPSITFVAFTKPILECGPGLSVIWGDLLAVASLGVVYFVLCSAGFAD